MRAVLTILTVLSILAVGIAVAVLTGAVREAPDAAQLDGAQRER